MRRTSPRRQSRPALARIHDKNKAAVGVILSRKDAWPQNRYRCNSVPALLPKRSSSMVTEQWDKEERSHRIGAGQEIGNCSVGGNALGTPAVHHRCQGGLFARFRTARTTVERSELSRIPRSANGGVLLL